MSPRRIPTPDAPHGGILNGDFGGFLNRWSHRGYRYIRTEYINGHVYFTVEIKPDQIRCSASVENDLDGDLAIQFALLHDAIEDPDIMCTWFNSLGTFTVH